MDDYALKNFDKLLKGIVETVIMVQI
jgi:hypothetical protein